MKENFDINKDTFTVLQSNEHEYQPSILDSFDVEFWKNNTYVKNIVCKIETISGHSDKIIAHISKSGRKEYILDNDTLFISLENLEDGILVPIFYNNSFDFKCNVIFGTFDSPRNKINISYVVCTYNRKQYINNIYNIFTSTYQRDDNINLVIIDNYGDCDLTQNHFIHIYKNANTGGSGGFTRGIYESCFGELRDSGFTHICLMDDDIDISEETILRNQAIFKFIKDKRQVGFALYAIDEKYSSHKKIQALGFRFNSDCNPTDIAIARNTSIYSLEKIIDISDNCQITGWWWHCFAVEDVKKIGLPYPFFIKMDDVEYCLRLENAGVKLSIPKNSYVYHERHDKKYKASTFYFRIKNRMILLSQLGIINFNNLLPFLTKTINGALNLRKYELAEAILVAIDDYLKGPEWNIVNYNIINSKINNLNKFEKNDTIDISGFINGHTFKEPSNILAKFIYMITYNGHFIPGKKNLKINTREKFKVRAVRNAKKVAYMYDNEIGYIVTRNNAKLIKLLFLKYTKCLLLAIKSKTIAEEYKKSKFQFISVDFWEKFLKDNLIEQNKKLSEGKSYTANKKSSENKNKQTNFVTSKDITFINSIRNIHLGKRCFIIGNGPSLSIDDLEKLKNEYTLASNKIYLAFDSTRWRPTYYSVEDILVAQNNKNIIQSLDGMTKIFPAHMRALLGDLNNHFFVKWNLPQNSSLPERHFSKDLISGVCWGSTITYTLMQIAVHLGFKKIYLLGLDHNYVESEEKKDGRLVAGSERNHFHPNYRIPGELWHYPRLERLERSYYYARIFCDSIGVQIVNASRNTKLDIFPKIDFEKLF